MENTECRLQTRALVTFDAAEELRWQNASTDNTPVDWSDWTDKRSMQQWSRLKRNLKASSGYVDQCLSAGALFAAAMCLYGMNCVLLALAVLFGSAVFFVRAYNQAMRTPVLNKAPRLLRFFKMAMLTGSGVCLQYLALMIVFGAWLGFDWSMAALGVIGTLGGLVMGLRRWSDERQALPVVVADDALRLE